jgi:hypothetical protein
MKVFSEWSDAEEWAEQSGRSLVPSGNNRGERVEEKWESDTSKVELHAIDYLYYAESERDAVSCLIKCYEVLIWEDKTTSHDYAAAGCYEEGVDTFTEWKTRLS